MPMMPSNVLPQAAPSGRPMGAPQAPGAPMTEEELRAKKMREMMGQGAPAAPAPPGMKCGGKVKKYAKGGQVATKKDNMPDWAKQQVADEKLREGSRKAYDKAMPTPEKYAKGGAVRGNGLARSKPCKMR